MHCRNIFKRLLSVVIALALVFGCFLSKPKVNSARAASISEMKDQISNLESEKNVLEGKIDELQNDVDQKQAYLDSVNSYIATVESKIMACENLLASYQADIDECNDNIAAKEEELKENKELFKRRVRSIYMSGSNTSMSLLLGSDEFADYLSMSQFTEGLANYDNALMKKINNSVKKINKQIKKKNDAIKEQEEIKKTLAADRADLQVQQGKASDAVNEVNRSKEELQAELDQLDANIAALESSIQAAYEAARQAALNSQIQYNGEGFAWPLPGYSMITSGFGMRYDPYYMCYRGHNGIDIAGAGIAGKPIVASANGTVISTMPTSASGGYGNYLIISHGFINGQLVTTHYAHMMSFGVSQGQTVKQGDVVGYVGTTGASTGYHLHFEVRVDNVPVNPLGYVSY